MPAKGYKKENGKTESITIRVTPEQKKLIKEYCQYQINTLTYSDFFDRLMNQFFAECKEDFGKKYQRHRFPWWWEKDKIL